MRSRILLTTRKLTIRVCAATTRSAISSMSSMTITRAARCCAQAFVRRLQADQLAHDRSDPAVETVTQLSRFKIWAGNIGVFAQGAASIEHRLRDDPDIKDVLVRMLQRLEQKIDELSQPIDSEIQREMIDEFSDSSSDSSTQDSEEEDLNDDDVGECSTRQRSSPLQRIQVIITNLYRITSAIKKPQSSREYDRVLTWASEGPADMKEELEELTSHLHWTFGQKHPGLARSTALTERLIETSVRRRKTLLYRQSHREKLQSGTEDWFRPRNPQSMTRSTLSPETSRSAFPLPSSSAAQKPVGLAQTQASSVYRAGFSGRAKPRTLQSVSPSIAYGLGQLDVPQPPKPEAEGMEVLCPYCNLALDQITLSSPISWKYDSTPPSSRTSKLTTSLSTETMFFATSTRTCACSSIARHLSKPTRLAKTGSHTWLASTRPFGPVTL
jgi:hypothetical protein